jgi:hypothetical protein
MIPFSRLRSLAELVAPTGQLLGASLSLGSANLRSHIANVNQPNVSSGGAAAQHLCRIDNAWETRLGHPLAQIRALASLTQKLSLVGCAGADWADLKRPMLA